MNAALVIGAERQHDVEVEFRRSVLPIGHHAVRRSLGRHYPMAHTPRRLWFSLGGGDIVKGRVGKSRILRDRRRCARSDEGTEEHLDRNMHWSSPKRIAFQGAFFARGLQAFRREIATPMFTHMQQKAGLGEDRRDPLW
jgi:hypothetical protein